MKMAHKGFTLIEVMAALTIVAVTFTIILGFESSLMTSTRRSSNRIQRTWAMSNYLYECHSTLNKEIEKDPKKIQTKKLEYPPVTLTYQQKPIVKESDLDDLENIILENVDIEWQRQQGGKITDRLINVRFAIKKEEKKP